MSYIGKNPKADSVKLNSTAVIPTGAAVEGQVYYNDGTGTISEGLKVYKNGNFVGIDKQLGDADTIALKKAVDVGSLQWAVAIDSTGATVGMNAPVPQYNATATGFSDSTNTTFSNTSSTNALLTDESADLVFAYESHTVNSKNDYYGVQIDIPAAFRGGNLVLEFEYRTAEASGATSDDDFRVAVQDHTNKGQTTATAATGSQAAGTSIAVGSSTDFAVGDKVWVESGTGNSGVQANDFTEAYVTAIADATHLTFSQTIIFPASTGGLIASGWLTDKVQGQLQEADSDTNKVGKKRSIQFKTEETTATVNVTFQNLSTSAAGIDLFVDNILLSANKFLQASSQGPIEEIFYQGRAGQYNNTPYFTNNRKNTLNKLGTWQNGTSTTYSYFTADQRCKVSCSFWFYSDGTAGGWAGLLKNDLSATSPFDTSLDDNRVGFSLMDSYRCEAVSWTGILEKGDTLRAVADSSGAHSSYPGIVGVYLTATPLVNDVIILESQDEIFTDWVDYTPVFETTNWTTSGPATVNKAKWRRVGDSMEVEMNFQLIGGTASATAANLPLPTGYSIDSAKSGGGSGNMLLGMGGWQRQYNTTSFNQASYRGPMAYISGNTTSVAAVSRAASTSTIHYSTIYDLWAPSDGVFISFRVPIAGWNANFNPLLSLPLVEIGANAEYYNSYDLLGGTSHDKTLYVNGTVVKNTVSNLGTVTNDAAYGWYFQSNQRVKVSISGSAGKSTGAGRLGFVKYSAGDIGTPSTRTNNGIGNAYWDGYGVGGTGTGAAANYMGLAASSFIMEPNEYVQLLTESSYHTTGNESVLTMLVEKDFSNTNMAHIIKPAVAILKSVYPYNAREGGLSAATWTNRTLNTIEGESWFVTLSGAGSTGVSGTNVEFTLEKGQYKIFAITSHYETSYTSSRLYDVTNGATVAWSDNGYIHPGGHNQRFTLTTLTIGSSTQYKMQTISAGTSSTIGFGYQQYNDSNAVSIYSQVQIEKLK